ncbi:MAG TPA: 5-carboxymethyl-2-hydroxymuconate isomerase [Xanthobacteraceae bacterium]|nr:5-carboxymethyl-2-hydroxymuconate isomerase [Xanthobacteraceae bacterium]
MPHVICEYSANLEQRIRIPALLETLHEAMTRTGTAELAGLRTRADRRTDYIIADNDPANGFVNVTIRVAKGRTVETRKLIAQTIFAAAEKHLADVFATTPFVLSVEVQEIDPEFRIHTSNIRERMKAKEAAA